MGPKRLIVFSLDCRDGVGVRVDLVQDEGQLPMGLSVGWVSPGVLRLKGGDWCQSPVGGFPVLGPTFLVQLSQA